MIMKTAMRMSKGEFQGIDIVIRETVIRMSEGEF